MKECIFLLAVSNFESFKYEINLGNKKLRNKKLYISTIIILVGTF